MQTSQDVLSLKEWNLTVAMSVMSAIILGELLLTGYRQPLLRAYYTFDGTSVHVDASAFNFGLFVLTGWLYSWVHLQFQVSAKPLDDAKYNFVGLAGLGAWVAGHALTLHLWRKPEDLDSLLALQQHYLKIAFINSFLITTGGSLFFWSVRTQIWGVFNMPLRQASVKRVLVTLYFTLPALYMIVAAPFSAALVAAETPLVQTWWFALVVGIAPAILCLFAAKNFFFPPEEHKGRVELVVGKIEKSAPQPAKPKGPTRKADLAAPLLHGLFLACMDFCFYVPFVATWAHAYQYGVPTDGIFVITMLLATGCLCGNLLISAVAGTDGYLSMLLPLLAIGQTAFLGAWAAIAGSSNVASLATIAFFLGLTSVSTLNAALLRSSQDFAFGGAMMHAIQMTFLVPGSMLLVYAFRELTTFGEVDFYTLLSISSGVSAAGVCASLASFGAAYLARRAR